MSLDLTKLSKNIKYLPAILNQYDDALDEIKNIIDIKGKTVNEALAEHSSWQLYYDQRRVELKKLVRFMEDKVKKTRGKTFKILTTSNQRDLSDRAKEKYIDQDKDFLAMRSVLYEVQEMYEKYESVSEVFKSRGFILNNLVKAKVAEIDGITI